MRGTARPAMLIGLWCIAGFAVASGLSWLGLVKDPGIKAAVFAGICCFGGIRVISGRKKP
ncbi:hypothetical protein [Streptomyces termitum]|uniref:hypothetical protein n=1 Tax=Streptomyces termitum TaxID=67368 RepID=UPI0033A614E5